MIPIVGPIFVNAGSVVCASSIAGCLTMDSQFSSVHVSMETRLAKESLSRSTLVPPKTHPAGCVLGGVDPVRIPPLALDPYLVEQRYHRQHLRIFGVSNFVILDACLSATEERTPSTTPTA
eukprot:COSAG06_NODE_2411_length_6920_cov_64.918634_6_plen_121_part_00